MVVSEFRLPWRKLPSDCRPDAALALADGPSLAEYDLQAIRECGATLCCYGRSAAVVSCKHYWITDFGHRGIIENAPPIEHVYACAEIFDSEVPKRIAQHGWIRAEQNCTFHPVIELAAGRFQGDTPFRHIFVLGVDVYRGSDGSLRAFKYSRFLPQLVAVDPEYFGSEEAWHQMNNSMNLYLSRPDPRIRNLGPSSAYSVVWGIDAEVLEQPYGKIDRQSPAVIVDCTGRFLPGSAVCPYSPLPIQAIFSFIRNLRSRNPQMPLFVRCADTLLERVDRELDGCDVLCGGVVCDISHENVFPSISTTYLPCPSD